MTAGAGVLHSEMPGQDGVHLLQLWLNLPAALKFSRAQFTCVRKGDANEVDLPDAAIRVYAGDVMGAASPYGSTWPLTLLDIRLERDAAVDLPLPAGQRAFAFVLEGHVEIGRNHCGVDKDRVAWLERSPAPSHRFDTVALRARDAARVLVYASPAIDEPMVLRGPFVMNTAAELDQAYADLRAGRLTEASGPPTLPSPSEAS
jgi:redox-sensitive bicupin YhaK (pirin superfamily)